jgi:hypothetical protein
LEDSLVQHLKFRKTIGLAVVVIRVLFMSGYNPEPSEGPQLNGNPTAFLAKPFSHDSLSRAIRELLDRPDG